VLLAPGARAAETEPRAIRAEITVPASAADVWKAWTTSEGIPTFFGYAAKVELRTGGPFEVYINPMGAPGQRGSEGCKVLSFVPNEMLSFTWNAPPTFPEIRAQRTFVVLRFEQVAPEKTRVRLAHLGWGAGEHWDQVFGYFTRAWPNVLKHLEQRFVSGPKAAVAPPDDNKAPRKSHWVYFIRPSRPELVENGTPEERRHIGAHFQYLKRLTEAGTVVAAGPTTQPPFVGIVIFEAPTREAAAAVMEGDPAVKAGVFKAELAPFSLSLLRKE
jgi:uncharacterized protein YndB with AHSA1/START domain/uncharacterized protein YciI